VKGDAELLEVIRALQPPGRFPSRLNRGQQEGHENADDGNDHQQFDERESGPGGSASGVALAGPWHAPIGGGAALFGLPTEKIPDLRRELQSHGRSSRHEFRKPHALESLFRPSCTTLPRGSPLTDCTADRRQTR
jgi:hypothetical protein